MQEYTKEGYRVIALASKELLGMTSEEVHKISRGEVESSLIFLGLLIMENKLKTETNGIIKELNNCKIRTLMATGDNVLTAISVARQCSIIHQKREVWFGDIATKPDTQIQYIEWKSTDKPEERDKIKNYQSFVSSITDLIDNRERSDTNNS